MVAWRYGLEGKQGSGIRADTCIHEFRIGLAAPFEYEYVLFEVRQTMDIYPLQVIGLDGEYAAECDSLEAFTEALRVILNAEDTKRRLNALYSQACDEEPDEATMPAPVMEHEFSPAPAAPTPEPSEPELAPAAPAPTPEEAAPVSDPVDSAAAFAEEDQGMEFAGYASVSEINSQFGIKLDTSYGDISSCLAGELGARPMIGDRLEKDGVIVEVVETSGRSVGQVRVYRA